MVESKGEEAGDVERVSSEKLLVMSAENLKKSIEYAVRQLTAKKVGSEVKLRWSRSLTQQVEALVKVAEALHKIGSKSATDMDLASYLSVLETKVPRRFVTKKFSGIVRRSRVSWSSHCLSNDLKI